MIHKPMEVQDAFPVRKSRKQKQAFRDAAVSYLQGLRYPVTVEKGSFGSHNVIAGDPRTAKYLVTAHYDTCASMIVPNLITPCNLFTFVLYQLFVVLVVFIPAIAVGCLVAWLTKDQFLAYYAWYALVWVNLILMMFGPANKHNSNDNTSGVVAVLEMARSMPEDQRDKVCFVLFDLEEVGLIGSASYRSMHKKECNDQIVLNLDCVGDGDEIRFFPTGKLKKNEAMMRALDKCCGTFGSKTVDIRRKGFAMYPSDQTNFPMGVGICALHKSKLGLYLGRIHTNRDTVLEETNINILRAALISLICCTQTDKKGNEE